MQSRAPLASGLAMLMQMHWQQNTAQQAMTMSCCLITHLVSADQPGLENAPGAGCSHGDVQRSVNSIWTICWIFLNTLVYSIDDDFQHRVEPAWSQIVILQMMLP